MLSQREMFMQDFDYLQELQTVLMSRASTGVSVSMVLVSTHATVLILASEEITVK